MVALALSLLGPFQATLDGQPLESFRTKATQALLVYLVCQPDQPQRREHLMALLWPGLPQKSAQANLRQTLYQLRQAIPEAPARDGGASVPFLLADRQVVQVNPKAAYELDVLTFEWLLAQGEERWGEAVALYRGDFLANFYLPDSESFEEWVLAQRAELRGRVLKALDWLTVRAFEDGDLETAEGYARRQLEIDNLRESAHGQLMEALARGGRRTEALAHYEGLVELLHRELGVEPSAETRALHERIRGGELSRAAVRADVPETPVRLPAFLQEGADRAERGRPVFVARERELAWLNERLERAAGWQGQVAFVLGDAGSGKTALLEAFVRATARDHPDMQVLWGSCAAFAGRGEPYLPFRESLAMLTGDVETAWASGLITSQQARQLWQALPRRLQTLVIHTPELVNTLIAGPALLARASAALPPASPLLAQVQEIVSREPASSADPQQGRLFEQVSLLLQQAAAGEPILLLLDDLHWADRGTVGLLFHLARRLATSRVLIVGAYRPEELAAESQEERHPLTPVLSELKRLYGDAWLNLADSEARSFVDRLLETEPNRLGESFRRKLFARTDGHALFTIELLREMQERGELVRDPEGWWQEGPSLEWERLPSRVEGVIEARIGRLDEELREILNVAAVEGQEFTVQVVARAGKFDERRILRTLSRDLEKQHRLVRERPAALANGWSLARYRFGHALFQSYLYNQLGQGERRLLHGDVVGAMEDVYAGRVEHIAPQMAWHYAEAGEEEKALPYLIQSGDQARVLYAFEEATAHYERALAILKNRGRLEQAARILMKLGLTYHNAFRYTEARHAYQEGFTLWQQAAMLEPASSLAQAPHPLRLAAGEPISLDPALATDTLSVTVIAQLFSGLVTLSPGLDVVPDLAQSWDLLDGGQRYLFHLRDDGTWSDGRPVTAHDFEYAWKRVLDPATQAPAAHKLYDIKGARIYHQREVDGAEAVGVQALDERTLQVLLERPSGYFLQLFADSLTWPVPHWAVQVHGASWTEPENIVTNGPFRLAAWERGRSMRLERNPSYHGHFSGNVETVELLLGAGSRILAEALARRYEAGELE